MLNDAREVSAGDVLEADVCIAGAGAAGITIARELRDSGLEVLLLEGGGEQSSQEHQDLYGGSSSGDANVGLKNCRTRAFGGSTNCWAGWCRPLLSGVFEEREWLEGPAWPFSREDLVAYYRRAAETIEIGAFEWDPASIFERRGDEILGFDADLARSYVYQYSEPTRFASAYRGDLAQADNLQVYLHANVVEIALGGDDTSVDHLACRTLEGTEFTARADRYVLAMGGIENPRMMLASGGIGNAHDHLGRYFMEHPHYYGLAVMTTRPDPALDTYLGKKSATTVDERHPDGRRTRVKLALGVPESVRREEQILASGATFGEIDLEGGDGRSGDIPSSRVAEALGIEEDDDRRLFSLTIRAEQSPHPDSRLTLADETDDLGVPRSNLHWKIPEETVESVQTTLEYLGAELGRLGVGRLWMPTDDQGRLTTGTARAGCHHMGTTRMSERPEDGVVDADCKVHGVANLYVAGSSVFPRSGFANPTYTICALAHRLAEHLESTS